MPDNQPDSVVTHADVQRMLVSQIESNIAVLQRVHEFDFRRCEKYLSVIQVCVCV